MGEGDVSGTDEGYRSYEGQCWGGQRVREAWGGKREVRR